MPRRPRAARPAASLAVAALSALSLAACTSTDPEPSPEPPAPPASTPPAATTEPAPTTSEPEAGQYGVAAGDPAAVEAGMSVLENGGNAVDAAIAAAFAVAVVEPHASGIGGGGSAIVVPDGDGEQAVAYDYREVVADDGVIPPSGTGIPGFVAGMGQLHETHGQADWADVLAPAISLAADGHPVSGMLARRLREDVGPGIVAELPHFRAGGQALTEGHVLVQEDLARTMRTLAEAGPDSFYAGTLADALTAVRGVDAGSLAGYKVVSDEPVRGAVGDHEVLAPLPPLPGAPLVQMLQVAHALDAGGAEPGSVAFVERISRAWQIADESVGAVLGDPAFVDVPVGRLTDAERNAELAAEVPDQAAGDEPAVHLAAVLEGDDATWASPSSSVVVGHEAPDSVGEEASVDVAAGNTTHISVVDSTGTAISMTNTLTHWFGSADYHAGFFLNDQLSRFSAIDSAANRPEPGRRSVSWSAPVVVLDDAARAVLVIGTPGGRLIPNILTGVYARWAWHGQSLEEAVAAPRFHLEGQTMRVEEALPSQVVDELAARGYDVEIVPDSMYSYGSVNALQVDPETGALNGAADPRRQADVAVGGG